MKRFYEETLEDLIFKTANEANGRGILRQCGLNIRGKLFRQIVIGNYGRTDLLSVYLNGKRDGKHRVYVTVYELKRDGINRKVVFQTAKYIYGLMKYFEKSSYSKKFSLIPKAVIIGAKIEDNSYYEFITSICPSLELFTYDYTITGLKFNKVKMDDRGDSFGALNEMVGQLDKSDVRELCDYIEPILPF